MNHEEHFREVIEEIKKIKIKYPKIEKIVLFGSRARGDHRYNSDIDLCVFAPVAFFDEFLIFSRDVEEIHTYYSFDILFWNNLSNELLKQDILKEGIDL